jgi:hypothetical protein
MKVNHFIIRWLVFAALLIFNLQLSTAFAQGTAFSYQGRLNDGGQPANGTNYGMVFYLYNVPTGGTALGNLGIVSVTVSNGLFTVPLDFGNQFDGTPRWLEISVQKNGGSFTTLSPRQQILPTPYAIMANTASNLLGTLPAAQLSGAVGNGQLANSSISVNAGSGLSGGGSVALGSSTTLANAGVLSVTGNSDITASTVGGAVTLGDTATSTNTPSTIVKRDASGNFSAGSVTLNGVLNLPATTAGTGIVYQGGSTLIHTYGLWNFFAGEGAGNLTTSGEMNTGVGYAALAKNTSGGDNTANGFQALVNNTSGNANTANGNSALAFNTSGGGNVANGVCALFFNTNGCYNTANGEDALFNNTSGYYNTAAGNWVLQENTSGSRNTADGALALYFNTSGSDNIALGYSAGYNLTTGNNNIDIGNQGVAGDNSVVRIGTTGTQTSTFIAGIYGNAAANGFAVYVNSSGQLGITTSSRRYKEGIQNMADASDVLYALKPVTFRYKPEIDPKGIPQFGLIAEEVDKVNPDLVVRDDQHGIYTVRYEAVNAMLLNEFLKQHGKVEKQAAEIEEQATEVQDLKARLEKLERLVNAKNGGGQLKY